MMDIYGIRTEVKMTEDWVKIQATGHTGRGIAYSFSLILLWPSRRTNAKVTLVISY